MARDLVLQKAVGNMKDQSAGKFTQNWEGPYQVTVVARVIITWRIWKKDLYPDHGTFII